MWAGIWNRRIEKISQGINTAILATSQLTTLISSPRFRVGREEWASYSENMTGGFFLPAPIHTDSHWFRTFKAQDDKNYSKLKLLFTSARVCQVHSWFLNRNNRQRSISYLCCTAFSLTKHAGKPPFIGVPHICLVWRHAQFTELENKEYKYEEIFRFPQLNEAVKDKVWLFKIYIYI